MWTLAQSDAGADAPPAADAVQTGIDKVGSATESLLSGDTGALMDLLKDYDYGLPVVWAIVTLVIALIVAKTIAGIIRRGCSRANVDKTLAGFFGKLVYYLVATVGVMFALGKFGINVTSFAAILAAAGFAVGMALSGTLANFAAGSMLLIFRPFKVGDVVNAAGITAKVHEIELFTTTFDTADNRRIIVPNGSIYGGTIENITYHPVRRVDVNVGCAYSADIDQTRAVLTGAAESLSEKNVQGEGRGFQVYLLELADSSVNWVVRFWTNTDDYWAVREALTRAVKTHLDEAGIGIPFPQMDVHLDGAVADTRA